MDCPEHERLEEILTEKRASVGRLAPTVHTVEFQKSLVEESRALKDLKDHDVAHGCQR